LTPHHQWFPNTFREAMARGKRYSDEIRAAIVAALLAGQGVSDVARKFKIDKSIVCRLRKKIPKDLLQRLATKQTDALDDLFSELLTAQLKTLRFVQDFVRTERGLAWLEKQSAAELATFTGITEDKAFRLCEASQPDTDGRPDKQVDPTAGTPNQGLPESG
jgi:transposase-like protein